MSLFSIFNVAGSAMSAQAQRLNVVASNIANADSTTSTNGQVYKAKQVVFSAVPVGGDAAASGVKVDKVLEKGYVSMPNVNVVEEMVNMISASRSYQTNVETMNAAKTLLLKTLTIGQ
jgi:flagellar basal-body rod protein FlgC